MTKSKLISFREFYAADEPFIYASWMKGLRYGSPLYKMIDHEIYFKTYARIIKILLSKSKVLIAALKQDPNVILGYSVFEDKKLHWVFVKEDWRGIGLAKDLVPKELEVVTHMTSLGSLIFKEKCPKAIFNPFL